MRVWAVLFLVGLSVPAMAQRVSKVDGNRLLQICEARAPAPLRPGLAPPPKRLECEAYLSGVADALTETRSRRACIPPNVTTQQLVAVVVKALRNHPESTQLPGGRLAVQAFATDFPCPP